MKKIIILASDHSSIPSTAGTLGIFNIANILWSIQNPNEEPVFECSVVSPNPKLKTYCRGLNIEFTQGIDSLEKADSIIIPGFPYNEISLLVEKIRELKPAVNWIRRQYDNGANIGASCSGTVMLAETGLLNGKQATTSWWLDNLFRTRYPKVKLHTNQILVDEGRLVTAGAVTSYLNLVLCFIRKFAGKDLALSCSKIMLIDYNKNYQAPYMMLQSLLNHSDKVVVKAQLQINENLQKKINLNDLAASLAVSYRTLIRRFKAATGNTPSRYLQKVRIETAKRLLETTNMNLESIIEQIGYSDLSSFNILFKRFTELTPKKYRQQFSVNN